MELRKLHHAVVLARHLNFTRAAEALNLTQSALSRSIHALEEECRLRLFERNRKSVAVTAVGRDFLRHAEVLLRKEGELLEMVGHAASGEGGTVTIGMAPLAARTLLAPLMTELIAAPGIHVQVQIGSQDRLFGMLRDEAVDLCVCTGSNLPAPAFFRNVPLARFSIGLIVRPGHPLTRLHEVQESDLTAFPLLRSRPFDQEFDGRLPEPRLERRPTLAVEDYDVLMQLATNSDAVWITASIAVREWVARGRLVELPIIWRKSASSAQMTLHVLKNRELSPLARRMTERLVALGAAFAAD
jgi:DNA-binding transcriptional LysR family regulator